MITYNCFACTQDKAMLESNLSGVQDLQGRRLRWGRFFLWPPPFLETKAINSGGSGAKPPSRWMCKH